MCLNFLGFYLTAHHFHAILIKTLSLERYRAGVTQWLEFLPSKQAVASSNLVSRFFHFL